MKNSKAVNTALMVIMLLFLSLYGCGGGGGSNDQQPDGDNDNSADGDRDRDVYIPPDGDKYSDGDADYENADVETAEMEADIVEYDLDDVTDGDAIDADEEYDTDAVDTSEEDADSAEFDTTENDSADSDEDIPDSDNIEDDVEVDTEGQCVADEEIGLDDLPFSVSRSTLNANSNYDGNQCFSYEMPGDDYVFSIELQKLDILEISLAPLEGSDFAIYILDSCHETIASCIEAADSNSAAENESLSFRAIEQGVYYIVVDSTQAGSGGSFEIVVELGQDNGVQPTAQCDSHMDCEAESGAGLCIMQDRWDASFCTLECEEDVDCEGFESGCCMPVPEFGGKFCYLAKYCGVAGMTALPGEACATENHPNMPLCDPIAGAEYCEDDKNVPYCSHSCTDDNECTDITGGCCVKQSPSAGTGTCVPGTDCPHSCTADVNIEHQNLPLTITNKSTSDYDNRVSAYDCVFTGTPGREVIFGVALNAGETLQATLSNSPLFDGVLYIAGGCGWTLAECGAFADNNGYGSGETLLYTADSSSTYYVAVDSTDFAQSGSFRLNLQLVDIGIDGDVEESEIDIEAEESEQPVDGDIEDNGCDPLAGYTHDELTSQVTVSGSTSGAVNDFQISGCGGSQQFGVDNYYAVEILAGDTLYALLDNTGDWDPSIAVYRNCAEGTCAKLTDSGLSSQDEYLTWTSNVNGTVYVVIDSPSPSGSGSYQLTLSLNEIVADGDSDTDSGGSSFCEIGDYSDIGSYDDLAGGGFTQTSSTTGAANHSEIDTGVANCLGTATPGPDKIYAIDLQYQQEIQITLSDVGDDFDPLLYVSSVCGKPIVCRAGSDDGGINEGEDIYFQAPANGTYYIVVDGPRTESDPSGGWYASGSYTITVTQAAGR